jgi:Xaa-Pro aminopeptidase
MKSDIDRLMQERDLDGLWITGSSGGNPALDYFTGSAHLSEVNIIKKRGDPPVLYHNALERDEAATTGLNTSLVTKSQVIESLQDAGGDDFDAIAYRLHQALESQGVSGRIAIHGHWEVGRMLQVVRKLEALMPGSQFVTDSGPQGALRQARLTKDNEEISRIRQIGQITLVVMDGIAQYLQSRPVVDEVLQDDDGQPLRVGVVKKMIHLMLAERGAEAPTGPIFAPGREGAIGHSVGRTDQVIKLGVPIVFDLYPRHRDGGYYFDFTRTWCLGYAPPEVRELYEDVLQIYQQNFGSMRAGASPQDIQIETCRLFEEQGHPTVMSEPDSQSGYFHALAHGLGLAIHEAPVFRHYDNPSNIPLEPGMVITYEPGLYYPERNMGVRLEDPVLILPEGPPQLLLEYPYDLVLPMSSD